EIDVSRFDVGDAVEKLKKLGGFHSSAIVSNDGLLRIARSAAATAAFERARPGMSAADIVSELTAVKEVASGAQHARGQVLKVPEETLATVPEQGAQLNALAEKAELAFKQASI
ncbi:unnamed protein product, partial [Prorocentrum cordatum]